MHELFELRQAVTRLYERCMTEAQTSTGLSRGELDVLLFLANHPAFDTATDVVRVRGLSKSHVSASVDKLARRGLLARRVEAGNRRVVRLSLLPAAEEAVACGRAAQEDFNHRLFRNVSPAEQTNFARILKQLCENAGLGTTDAPAR